MASPKKIRNRRNIRSRPLRVGVQAKRQAPIAKKAPRIQPRPKTRTYRFRSGSKHFRSALYIMLLIVAS